MGREYRHFIYNLKTFENEKNEKKRTFHNLWAANTDLSELIIGKGDTGLWVNDFEL